MARACWRGSSKSATTIPSATAAASAPPAPWTNRAATSHCADGRHAAQHRRGDEQRQAGQQHAAAADEVADPPGQQEQAAEGDEVGVDDPREVRGGKAEVALDRGQGDADDGLVDDGHERRRAQQSQCETPVAGDRDGSRSGHAPDRSRSFCYRRSIWNSSAAERHAALRCRRRRAGFSRWKGAASGPATSCCRTARNASRCRGATSASSSS